MTDHAVCRLDYIKDEDAYVILNEYYNLINQFTIKREKIHELMDAFQRTIDIVEGRIK
jgi:hypothetical protein